MEKFEILNSEEELVKSLEADMASAPVVESDSTPEPIASQTIDDPLPSYWSHMERCYICNIGF